MEHDVAYPVDEYAWYKCQGGSFKSQSLHPVSKEKLVCFCFLAACVNWLKRECKLVRALTKNNVALAIRNFSLIYQAMFPQTSEICFLKQFRSALPSFQQSEGRFHSSYRSSSMPAGQDRPSDDPKHMPWFYCHHILLVRVDTWSWCSRWSRRTTWRVHEDKNKKEIIVE